MYMFVNIGVGNDRLPPARSAFLYKDNIEKVSDLTKFQLAASAYRRISYSSWTMLRLNNSGCISQWN